MSQILQPGQHLDPDQLSAFVESALPKHERLATLAHLSECSHCRQIVFLSQQALPQTATTPHPAPVWTRWFTSTPGLSLAAASFACALIVAVSLHLHHTSQSPAVATTATPSSAPHPAEPTAGSIAEPRQEGNAAAATSPAVLATPHPQPKAVSPAPLPTHSDKPNKAIADGQGFEKPLTPQINGVTYGAIRGTGSSNSMPILKSLLGQPQQQATTSQNAGLAPAPSTKPLDQAASSGAALALLPAQSRNTNETVSVVAAPAQIQTETTDADNLFARTANAKKNAQATLPSNLAIMTTISNGHQTLAVDTAGALFLSLDAGQHWTLVDQQWTGKAAQLSLAASPSTQPSQQRGAIHGAVSAAMSPARAGVNTNAAATTTIPLSFQLTTDSGAVWTSPDGLIWKPR